MNTDLLAQRLGQLRQRRGADGMALHAIHAWLSTCQELERFRINPYVVAHWANLPPARIVNAFLFGVHASVFDLHWDIHCPICYMITSEYAHLGQVKSRSYCALCRADFDAELLSFVEVTFSLTQELDAGLDFSTAGEPPADLKPHFRIHVPAGATLQAEDTLAQGTYFFVSTSPVSDGILVVEEACDRVEPAVVRVVHQEDGILVPNSLTAHAGRICIEIQNRGKQATSFWVADAAHPPVNPATLPARLTGLEVLHFSAFNDLFQGQVLSLREHLHIAAVTVMFTDITGSTRMYERLGDAAAYNVVRDHFDILFAAITQHGGTVLKTIGDAVMASFIGNAAALESLQEALQAFALYNQVHQSQEQIYLKIGVHRGPAVLVTLNGRLDYFGSTINKAARIQSQAGSNELVVSQSVFEDPLFQEALARTPWGNVQRYVGHLKGIEAAQVLYKMAVHTRQEP